MPDAYGRLPGLTVMSDAARTASPSAAFVVIVAPLALREKNRCLTLWILTKNGGLHQGLTDPEGYLQTARLQRKQHCDQTLRKRYRDTGAGPPAGGLLRAHAQCRCG